MIFKYLVLNLNTECSYYQQYPPLFPGIPHKQDSKLLQKHAAQFKRKTKIPLRKYRYETLVGLKKIHKKNCRYKRIIERNENN